MSRRILFAALLGMVLLLGCSFARQVHRRSNLMSYLYPKATEAPLPSSQGVRLRLPLRVGIAFVPSEAAYGQYGGMGATMPGTVEKNLLNVLRDAFKSRDWVKEVVVIPSNYLTPGGGFTNLDQVSQMFGVDVIALVSVDQFQSSDPYPISFLYLSIVGAYVLPLDHNDTRTLIDAAVFYVPARRFLLRAPGQSRITGHSTAVDVGESMRERSVKGLSMAMSDLSVNLSKEADAFKQDIISGERNDVEVINKQGTSIRTSGSIGWLWALSLLLLVAMRRWWS
ncbi:MAG TPA: rhombotarget lipoprotein [Thermoanaerobaculia bacterium]|jgi:rhombotail lipoprotein|nr:rhombotarget lipoprotein [Thermoanaerobaculia bacterium]